MAAPELVVRVAARLDALRANLKEGVAQIETTTAHMRSMSNAYDGSRIISQAGATTAAIHQMGGAAKLTVTEQARVNAVLTEAIEKYRSLGQQAPPSMTRLAEQTKGASNSMGELRSGLSQVDRVLGSMGITIGPQVAALNELSMVSGKTAAQLGLVATAGLALAAGAAGWQIGSLIAQFTQADEKLGDWLATVLGWNPAAQEAAAVTDVLARASAFAKREITDYTEAIKINNEAARQQIASHINFETTLLRAKMRVAELTETDWKQIAAAQELGVATELLTIKFNFNAAELAVVRQRLQEKTAATTEDTQAAKKLADAQTELKSAGDGWRGTVSQINQVVAEQVKRYLEAGVSQSALATVYNLTATQVKALATAIQEEKKAIEAAELAEEKKAATSARALADTTRLWNEYNELVVQRTGTTTEIQIAAVDRWASDVKLKAQQAGTDTAEFYAAVAAIAKEKTAAVMVDWDALREHSKLSLDETAAKAWATYQAMLERSGEFANGTIEQYRKQAEAAQSAADTFGTSFSSALDVVDRKHIEAANRVVSTWMEAMSEVARGTGVMTGSIQGVPGAPLWSWDKTRLPPLPGRAEGGPVSQGQPYLVGEKRPEVFVPERSGTILPFVPNVGRGAMSSSGSVSIVNHITVQGMVVGTTRELAHVVKDALMKDVRARGFRNPSGA